ncbi:protocatechuate 3,4-dioxygenase [uncultured Methylibium sp.]|uniref:protocatechuate 3,4-dioxygenase n=1 Tax=uncultured Methylibium sp. TaxID=381093 RepID=UPI0025E728D8|nr:protocatechuate 3,4-dioxygenase [uncultured Methylibium sp.]
MSGPTPSQTIGPFPHEGWRWAFDGGEGALLLDGRVLDGDGQPVGDAVVEAWPSGAERTHFLRVPTDEQGAFRLAFASRPAPGEPLAHLVVFARGLLRHQFTAVFLADDAGLASSPLLAQVPVARRATLLALAEVEGRYRWDLHLQGPQETVFFDPA